MAALEGKIDWKRDRSRGPGIYWLAARRGCRAAVIYSEAPLVGVRIYELRIKRMFGGWRRRPYDSLIDARDAGEAFLLREQ